MQKFYLVQFYKLWRIQKMLLRYIIKKYAFYFSVSKNIWLLAWQELFINHDDFSPFKTTSRNHDIFEHVPMQLKLEAHLLYSLPWEFGSGNVSLATKCITVVLPKGSFNAVWKIEDDLLTQSLFSSLQNTHNWIHNFKLDSLVSQLPTSYFTIHTAYLPILERSFV